MKTIITSTKTLGVGDIAGLAFILNTSVSHDPTKPNVAIADGDVRNRMRDSKTRSRFRLTLRK
ncbi:MAG: hypothetical protein WCV79_01820 [Candidatus Paceibacterota bacterium]